MKLFVHSIETQLSWEHTLSNARFGQIYYNFITIYITNITNILQNAKLRTYLSSVLIYKS